MKVKFKKTNNLYGKIIPKKDYIQINVGSTFYSYELGLKNLIQVYSNTIDMFEFEKDSIPKKVKVSKTLKNRMVFK